MSEIYVMKATFERNASDGIQHFTDHRNLASAVLEAYDAGATNVRVFRCVEVEFNAYWESAGIDFGSDKNQT